MSDIQIFSKLERFPLGLNYYTEIFEILDKIFKKINIGYKYILLKHDLVLYGEELNVLESQVKEWLNISIQSRDNPNKPRKMFKGYFEKQIFGQTIRFNTIDNPDDKKLNYMFNLFLVIEKAVKKRLSLYFYNVSGLDDTARVFQQVKNEKYEITLKDIQNRLQEYLQNIRSSGELDSLQVINVKLQKLIAKNLIEEVERSGKKKYIITEKGNRVYL